MMYFSSNEHKNTPSSALHTPMKNPMRSAVLVLWMMGIFSAENVCAMGKSKSYDHLNKTSSNSKDSNLKTNSNDDTTNDTVRRQIVSSPSIKVTTSGDFTNEAVINYNQTEILIDEINNLIKKIQNFEIQNFEISNVKEKIKKDETKEKNLSSISEVDRNLEASGELNNSADIQESNKRINKEEGGYLKEIDNSVQKLNNVYKSDFDLNSLEKIKEALVKIQEQVNQLNTLEINLSEDSKHLVKKKIDTAKNAFKNIQKQNEVFLTQNVDYIKIQKKLDGLENFVDARLNKQNSDEEFKKFKWRIRSFNNSLKNIQSNKELLLSINHKIQIIEDKAIEKLANKDNLNESYSIVPNNDERDEYNNLSDDYSSDEEEDGKKNEKKKIFYLQKNYYKNEIDKIKNDSENQLLKEKKELNQEKQRIQKELNSKTNSLEVKYSKREFELEQRLKIEYDNKEKSLEEKLEQGFNKKAEKFIDNESKRIKEEATKQLELDYKYRCDILSIEHDKKINQEKENLIKEYEKKLNKECIKLEIEKNKAITEAEKEFLRRIEAVESAYVSKQSELNKEREQLKIDQSSIEYTKLANDFLKNTNVELKENQEKLEKDFENLHLELKALKLTNTDLEDRQKLYLEKIQQSEKELVEVKKEKDDALLKCSNYLSLNKNLFEKLKKNNKELEYKNKELSVLESNLEELKNINFNLSNTLKYTIESHEQHNKERNNENAINVNKLKNEIKLLKEDKESLEKNIQISKQKILDNNATISSLQNKLKESNEKFQKLEQENVSQKKEYESLQKEYNKKKRDDQIHLGLTKLDNFKKNKVLSAKNSFFNKLKDAWKNKEHKNQISDIQTSYENFINQQEKKHDQSKNDQRKTYQDNIEQLKIQISHLQNESEEKDREYKEKLEKNLQNTFEHQRNYDEKIADLQKQYQNALAQREQDLQQKNQVEIAQRERELLQQHQNDLVQQLQQQAQNNQNALVQKEADLQQKNQEDLTQKEHELLQQHQRDLKKLQINHAIKNIVRFQKSKFFSQWKELKNAQQKKELENLKNKLINLFIKNKQIVQKNKVFFQLKELKNAQQQAQQNRQASEQRERALQQQHQVEIAQREQALQQQNQQIQHDLQNRLQNELQNQLRDEKINFQIQLDYEKSKNVNIIASAPIVQYRKNIESEIAKEVSSHTSKKQDVQNPMEMLRQVKKIIESNGALEKVRTPLDLVLQNAAISKLIAEKPTLKNYLDTMNHARNNSQKSKSEVIDIQEKNTIKLLIQSIEKLIMETKKQFRFNKRAILRAKKGSKKTLRLKRAQKNMDALMKKPAFLIFAHDNILAKKMLLRRYPNLIDNLNNSVKKSLFASENSSEQNRTIEKNLHIRMVEFLKNRDIINDKDTSQLKEKIEKMNTQNPSENEYLDNIFNQKIEFGISHNKLVREDPELKLIQNEVSSRRSVLRNH